MRALVLVLVGCLGCLVAPDEVRTRDGGALDTRAEDTATADARPDAPQDTADVPQDAASDTGRAPEDVGGDTGADAGEDAPDVADTSDSGALDTGAEDTATADARPDAPEDAGPCPVGFGNCDGNAANGCEAELAYAVQNCGACGVNCAPGYCYNGACR